MMSHSVFRDFDDEHLDENNAKNNIADQNLIVFINKDGDVTVDQSALQDLIVNANTDKKSTVSVIRLGSPTPSMESEKSIASESNEADENSETSDDNEPETSEESSDQSDDDESVTKKSTNKRKKQKSKKSKDTIPSISLTVDNFYGPTQAVALAEEIMNIAGITNPKQLKANYEYLRYVIENDHCYTQLTYADIPTEATASSAANPSSSKVTAKKSNSGRPTQTSNKPSRTTSVDKESSRSRLRSSEDANSSIENSGERSSEGEEEQSESDYSDFSVSESDNDRDSDLDFSVNDLHSKRTRKKRNKRIAKQAKKLTKKQQREAMENTPDATASDDTSTPINRKKAYSKLPKRQSANAKASPTTPVIVSRPVGRPPSAKKDAADESTPITVKQPIKLITRPVESTPVVTVAVADTESANKNKSLAAASKAKEKKPNDALFSDMSSLFSTPDIIKKVETDGPKTKVIGNHVTPGNTMSDQSRKVQQPQQQIRTYHVRNVKLASEQDKHLDLIDSVVQELSKEPASSAKSAIVTTRAAVESHIPNIVKMLETPPSTSAKEEANYIANSFVDLTNSNVDIVDDSFGDGESLTAKQQKKLSDEEKLLADGLLDNFANSDDYLTEDLLQHVAQLVEDKNLQEVIDQQLGLEKTSTSAVAMLPARTNNNSPKIVKLVPVTPITKAPLAVDRTPKTPVTVTPSNANKPKTIIRSDGRVITLPPIEAPTTRGAKRRAANPTVAEQPQPTQRILLNSFIDTTPVTDASANTIATLDKSGNIIAITGGGADKTPTLAKERRTSLNTSKRASIDTPKRKTSTTTTVTAADNAASIDDFDDDDDRSDGSYNSEDDPLRLWCICRQPHNNRFMICCDKCEDWFHGKCVGITKQMGTEMEQRRAEWICPNCKKKLQPSISNIFPLKSSSIDSSKQSPTTAEVEPQTTEGLCVICHKNLARDTSIFCSDDCIVKHSDKAQTTTTTIDNTKEAKQPLKSPPLSQPRILNALPGLKIKTTPAQTQSPQQPQKRIIYDKKANKYMIRTDFPMERLERLLKQNPHLELVRPNSPQWVAWEAKQSQLKFVSKQLAVDREISMANQPPPKVQTTLKFDADKKILLMNPHKNATPTSTKKVVTPVTSTKTLPTANTGRSKRPSDTSPLGTPSAHKKRSEEPKPTPIKSPVNSRPEEKIRENVCKTLCEHLVQRTRESDSAKVPKKLSDDEIKEFVTATEVALFKMFGDTNQKYKAKYRSLIFNIKDRKNETLFAKISSKSIQAEQLVRMTPEELASQELAKWRENENKHQLEMITKSELDMLASAKNYVLKSHKGEEVIETSGERVVLDPSIGVADVVSVLNSSTVSSTSEAAHESTGEKPTHLIVKDNRYDKYLGTSSSKLSGSSSTKKSSERSKSRDRHDSSRSSSSKHKRKRSRERSRERSHRDKDRDEKRHKSRDNDRKDRSSSDGKRDKYKSGSTSSSSSRSKHYDNDKKRDHKDKSRSGLSPPEAKTVRKEEKSDLSIRIDEAQSIIDRIVNPQEAKKPLEKVEAKDEAPKSTVVETDATAEKSQPNVANESDQEPSSTVTIPTPPDNSEPSPILWNGSMSMIDVATFDISLSAIDGDPAHLTFPTDLEVIGRITPEAVGDYISKIRLTKEIVLLRFSPTTEDDGAAYKTFANYLDQRHRLGVIKADCSAIKDFYVLPLPKHKSLPAVFMPSESRKIDLGEDRNDLLLGIVVKNSPATAPARRSATHTNQIKVKLNTSATTVSPFSAFKISSSRASTNIPLLKPSDSDDHYTPPSSPKVLPKSSKEILQSTFAMDIEDGDEPYSPEDSDEGDPTHLLPASVLAKSTVLPIPTTVTEVDAERQRAMEELNREIETQKMEIALLHTAAIDEPYSPSNSVSPPIPIDPPIPELANISIPANLADILKSIKSTSSTTSLPTTSYDSNAIVVGSSAHLMPNYSTISSHMLPTEYVLQGNVPTFSDLLGSTSDYNPSRSEPSKLAQLTDEELLRLVPDDSLIHFNAPSSSKSAYEYEPGPPGIDDDEEYFP